MSEHGNGEPETAVEGLTLDAVGATNPEPPGEASPNNPAKTAKTPLTELVDEPAKVMRIGTMVRQLLEEVKSAPLDDAARARLAEIHHRSITELEEGLSPELVAELERLSLPFSDSITPSDAELRIAQAQLVGWLEGLFHGLQTAVAAQQLANQQQGMAMAMRSLPPGTVIAPGVVIGQNGEPQRATEEQLRQATPSSGANDPGHGPGQYL